MNKREFVQDLDTIPERDPLAAWKGKALFGPNWDPTRLVYTQKGERVAVLVSAKEFDKLAASEHRLKMEVVLAEERVAAHAKARGVVREERDRLRKMLEEREEEPARTPYARPQALVEMHVWHAADMIKTSKRAPASDAGVNSLVCKLIDQAIAYTERFYNPKPTKATEGADEPTNEPDQPAGG